MLTLLIAALLAAACVRAVSLLAARARSYRTLRAVVTRFTGRAGGAEYCVDFDYVLLCPDTTLRLRANRRGVRYSLTSLCAPLPFASGIAFDTQESIDEIEALTQAHTRTATAASRVLFHQGMVFA